LWISIFEAIDELVKFKNPNFALLDPGFEELGLELDNCGRTIKNAYCRVRVRSLQFECQVELHAPAEENNPTNLLKLLKVLYGY
jgi:hypothetical protein